MKKNYGFIVCLMIFVLIFTLSSCVVKIEQTDYDDKLIVDDLAQKENESDEKEKLSEEIETGDNLYQEEQGNEQAGELNKEALMLEIGATPKTDTQIGDEAVGFMESLKNDDLEAVAYYINSNAENYEFLYDVDFEYELIPIMITSDEVKYTYDYLNMYMCVIQTNDENLLFDSPKDYYFLATDEYSATGNSVAFFTPFENVKYLFKDSGLELKYEYLLTDFLGYYSDVLDVGENDISQFDFNNRMGYHYIPHLMYRFDSSDDYMSPYTLNEINGFISGVFNGNKGIVLDSVEDYEIWVSVDTSSPMEFGPDDAVYGCYNGHGLNSKTLLTKDVQFLKSGVYVTVQSFGDYASFMPSREYVFKFSPQVVDEPLVLESIEMTKNTEIAECVYSF